MGMPAAAAAAAVAIISSPFMPTIRGRGYPQYRRLNVVGQGVCGGRADRSSSSKKKVSIIQDLSLN